MSLHRGRRAERRAERLLTSHGLELVARNYFCRFGELDLVMDDRGTLVIVEVRMRTRNALCSPAESVDAAKRSHIVTATRHFLAATPAYRDRPVRFDLVAFGSDAGENSPEWIRDAFRI